jgi:4-diphosphocytidyl-2-C-methyl-D-erythritol kinase
MLRLPALPGAPVLLLLPPVAVSTPDAYRLVDEARQGIGLRGAVAFEPETLTTWGNVARVAGNDFEFALFGRHPELRRGYEALAATHPILCRMTGSGSTIFAVYRTTRERDEAKLALSPKLGRVVEADTVG